MELNELLKQFKRIEPDKDYSRRSLNLILYSAPARKPTLVDMLFKSAEFGAAIALAGLLIFVIAGGFSSTNIPSPLQLSNLDPAMLKAEAQAIDMQIQLVNLNYNEQGGSGVSGQNESTAPVASLSKKSSGALGSSLQNASGTASSSLSVDEALQWLSK